MRVGAKYYAILSGEHPRLPVAELEAILEVESDSYRVVMHLDGLAVFDAEMADPSIIARRAGWVREVGELVYIGESSVDNLEDSISPLIDALAEKDAKLAWVEARRFKGYGYIGESQAERIIMKGLKGSNIQLSRRAPLLVRVFLTEGVVVVGIRIAQLDTRQFNDRRPRARPFFKPGPLSPQLSRVFVNLSRLKRGGTYLDPFCGTGGFAIEACMIGAGRVVCGDIDKSMASGALVNLNSYSCGESLVYHGNALKIPLGDEVIDSIATDPPYGRSTTTAKQGYERLVDSFIEEASRVARKGSYIVYAGPYKYKPWRYAVEEGLRVIGRYHMYVHSSLTREIVVARKVE